MNNIIVVNTITHPKDGEYYGKIYYNIDKDKLYFKNKSNKVRILGHTRSQLLYKETKLDDILEIINSKLTSLNEEINSKLTNIKEEVSNNINSKLIGIHEQVNDNIGRLESKLVRTDNSLIYQGVWDINVFYRVNDLIHDSDNNLYICISDNEGMCPSESFDQWCLLCHDKQEEVIDKEIQIENKKEYIYGYYDGDNKLIDIDELTSINIPINYIISKQGESIKNLVDENILIINSDGMYKFRYNICFDRITNARVYIKLMNMFDDSGYEIETSVVERKCNQISHTFYYIYSSSMFEEGICRILLLVDLDEQTVVLSKRTWLHVSKK